MHETSLAKGSYKNWYIKTPFINIATKDQTRIENNKKPKTLII